MKKLRLEVSVPALPDALVLDILERLPVGDVVRSRRVCKGWHAMINGDPVFARAHLQRARAERRQQEMAVVSPCSAESGPFLKLYRYVEFGARPPLVSRVLLRRPQKFNRSIVHCDGVLVVCSEAEMFAWNPATGETVQLPRGTPSFNASRSGNIDRLGFCYDAAARALKVVRHYYRAHDVEAGTYSLGVEVLTLGKGRAPPSWRPAPLDPPCPIYELTAPASVGNTVYWVIDDRFLPASADGSPVAALLAFDVTTEEYSIIQGPPCGDHWRRREVSLGNMGGTLCVVAPWLSLLATVWLLRTVAPLPLLQDGDGDGNIPTWRSVLRVSTEYILARMVPVGSCERTGEMLLLVGSAMHHCCASTGAARTVVDIRRQLEHCCSSRGPIAKKLVFMYSPSLVKISC